MKYKGFSSYETWALADYLDERRRDWLEIAKVMSPEGFIAHLKKDFTQAMQEGLVKLPTAAMNSLSAGFDKVNWEEIADHFKK